MKRLLIIWGSMFFLGTASYFVDAWLDAVIYHQHTFWESCCTILAVSDIPPRSGAVLACLIAAIFLQEVTSPGWTFRRKTKDEL